MRAKPWIVGLAGGVAATLLPKSIAQADTFSSGGGEAGVLADSLTHTFCRGSAPDAQWDNEQAAMAYLQANTVMNVAELNSCAATTDVRWDGRAGLGAGSRGEWGCLDYDAPSNVCDAARIRVFVGAINANSPAGTEENNLNKTLRHEMGHSVGLRHYKTTATPCCPGTHDAMISGAIDNGAVWTVYSQHHKDHIDNEYP